MPKLSRSQLKNIVKECLVEILQEGISPEVTTDLKPRPKKRSQKQPLPSSPALDQVKFESKVSQTVNELTTDPLMSSIFADTAKTTLQEQYDASIPGQAPTSEMVDPSMGSHSSDNSLDVFGGSASNWATLAFADEKK